MIKHLSMLMATIGLSFLMSGCGAAKLTPEVTKTFQDKSKMYTQSNMHYNVSRSSKIIDTTNYQIGTLIPVNSLVTMQDVNAKQLTFLYEGQKITLRNIAKYSGMGISDVASKYFSTKKVNLSQFSKAEQKAIESAGLVKGMSKSAVLLSLGTPPQHRTPDLKTDTWVYWKNRWTTFVVSFNKGKVISDESTTK
ncbi:MAG: hypothetical protein PF437_11375 [Sulfurimonas sp.]|jgi:hypothetical protein|nr:hypothetical protein [Sulfurimonas sp.]